MAKVAVKLKIMPSSPDIDLKVLSDEIAARVAQFGRIHSCEESLIAFGLKALLLTVIVEDKEGGTEALETSISEIDAIESVQAVAVSRTL